MIFIKVSTPSNQFIDSLAPFFHDRANGFLVAKSGTCFKGIFDVLFIVVVGIAKSFRKDC